MTMLLRLLVLCLFFIHACLADTAQRVVPIPQATQPFEFHSNFWINLHHFLYEQALQKPRHSPGDGSSLSSQEREAWDTTVEFYRKNIVSHDLLLDRAMQSIDTALSAHDDSESLPSLPREDDLRSRLESVAAIYRDHWWPAHNAANRFWIAVVTPLVQHLLRNIKGIAKLEMFLDLFPRIFKKFLI